MVKRSEHRKVQPDDDDNLDVWPKVRPPRGKSELGHARIRAAVKAVLDRKKAAQKAGAGNVGGAA
jgi:hypothetical protein